MTAIGLAAGLVATLLPLATTPVVAADGPVTLLVIDGQLAADGAGSFTGQGWPDFIHTRWQRGGAWWEVDIYAPVGNTLQPGTFPVGYSRSPTAGVIVITARHVSEACSAGSVTVLEAPALDAQNNLLSFAADWVPGAGGTGCSSGSIRVGSSAPAVALALSPDPLDFGAQAPHVPVSREIEVRNAGTQVLAVLDASVGLSGVASPDGVDDFTVTATTCGATLAPAGTCAVTVVFRPTGPGRRSARLSVTTTPETTSTIEMYGEATQLAIAGNDAIADAAEVAALPYAYQADVSAATTDRLDPVCDGGYRRSVWFHFRPSETQPVAISTAASATSLLQADTVVSVYDGAAPDGLHGIVCGDNVSDTDLTSLVRFPAAADHDYWISVTQGQTGELSGLWLTIETTSPDTAVDVSGWARTPTTYYPYPDSYLDTVLTTATLGEPADVSIDVVAAAAPSTVLRHVLLGRREGPYGWRWNGRTDAGSTVASGSYLLRHRYTDVFGNTATHDVPVTVSAKRLKWLTTTKVLYGSKSFSRGHDKANGRAYPSGTTMVLKSSTGYAYATYRFTLNSAVRYGTVRFEVVGRSTTGRKATLEIWNTDMGGWHWATRVGPGRATWRMPTTSAWDHVYGRYAYGKIGVRYTSGAVNWIVEKARLTYTYAVLQ